MESLAVEVTAVRFAADDFAVLAAVTDDGEEVVLTGPLAHVCEGEALQAGGEWRAHPKHGRQFHVARVLVRGPVSETAVLAYLQTIKHVGPRGAAWLVEHHGGEVLALIDRDPGGVLASVPGIGRRRLGEAVRSWEAAAATRAVRLFLEEHGVPAAPAARLVRAFGASAIETLRSDPYAATEVPGIGFATADALARALGVAPDSPTRLEAGLVHALAMAEDDGHSHLPRAELEQRARRLLGAEAGDRIDELCARGRLVVDERDRVADPELDAVERRLAARVAELATGTPTLRLEQPARPAGLSDDQWAGVGQVLEHRLAILTGGPGTGKTTSMRALVELVRGGGRRVRLCAPTGKAARRLAESAGHEATTIHRLLEWAPEEGGFARDESDPIPGCDLLVVDEASMLSLRLADALLQAVGPRTHVLLVGDADQLPPVGAGRVLDDLLESGRVPAVALTEIFRQARRSLIVRAAHAINHGEHPPSRPAAADDLRDFFLVTRETPQALFEEAVSLAAVRLPAHYAVDPIADVVVLAPMHRGIVGIEALNEALRARLNPDGEPVAATGLRVGDRVLETVNNHERELMNGQTAVLRHHDREAGRVLLAVDDGRRLTLELEETRSLRLAYAMSVHKAQGSSAKVVVVVLDRGHQIMLTRNLLYTAVTRAEQACVVVCHPAALQTALSRADGGRRHTRLAELVAG